MRERESKRECVSDCVHERDSPRVRMSECDRIFCLTAGACYAYNHLTKYESERARLCV